MRYQSKIQKLRTKNCVRICVKKKIFFEKEVYALSFKVIFTLHFFKFFKEKSQTKRKDRESVKFYVEDNDDDDYEVWEESKI